MRYTVQRSATQAYEFDGQKIASSSSRNHNSTRWVEFNLYLTLGGSYILERLGKSIIFHDLSCGMVEKYNLRFDPSDTLEPWHMPCETCSPYLDEDDEPVDPVVIEKTRFYALLAETPDAVLSALHRRDEFGSVYMTKVTQRLVEDASKYDKRLANAYKVEFIR